MNSRLSVLLITYNHQAYIAEAIESIMMQNISESFEIVVADDASSDKTLDILRGLAVRYPSVPFRFLDASPNLGITKNYQRAFAVIESEYVAVIEGDDYWTDPSKLQLQFDFLNKHRECDLCSANYYIYEEDTCRYTARSPEGEGFIVFGARELIADNLVGNFSTCMYRTSALKSLPAEIFNMRSYDWAVNICVGKQKLIGFLKSPMSVYRIHKGGAWSLLTQPEKIRAQIQLIPGYDKLTNGVFNAEFMQLSSRLSAHVADMSRIEENSAPLEHSVAVLQQPSFPAKSAGLFARIIDYMPPFLLTVARQLIPPALKRKLVQRIFG
jgi:glycosyltransferase involved in cell wall biosynthesis